MAASPVSPVRRRLGQAGWIAFAPGNETVNVLLLYFIFAPYVTNHVVTDAAHGQTLWGLVAGAAGLVVALAGPVVGSVADIVGGQKRFFFAFVTAGAVGAALLWFAVPAAPAGLVAGIALAGGVAIVGVELAGVVYNSLLPGLADRDGIGRLSGTAIGVGVIWGLATLGAYLSLFVIPDQPFLGLDKLAHEQDRISGPVAAAALMLFALPLMAFTPAEPLRRVCVPVGKIARGIFADTYRAMRAEPNAGRFVIARMIYQDGIGVALAFGSIYAAGLFGWTTLQLAVFGMCILGASALGSIAGGFIDDRIGARRTIALALTMLLVAVLALLSISPAEAGPQGGFFATEPERIFLGCAILLGLSIGPAQGAGRTMMARIAPAGHIGQWYGIMALTGNAAAFTGPLLVALVTGVTGDQRMGLAVAPLLIAVGFAVLLTVKPDMVRMPQRRPAVVPVIGD